MRTKVFKDTAVLRTRCSLTPKFYPVEKFSSCRRIFVQNYKICDWNFISEKSGRGKVEIFSTHINAVGNLQRSVRKLQIPWSASTHRPTLERRWSCRRCSSGSPGRRYRRRRDDVEIAWGRRTCGTRAPDRSGHQRNRLRAAVWCWRRSGTPLYSLRAENSPCWRAQQIESQCSSVEFTIYLLLTAVATVVLFLALFFCFFPVVFVFFFSVNMVNHEPLHSACWNFARTWNMTTARSLLNFKVIC